jgi:hypothetical protein
MRGYKVHGRKRWWCNYRYYPWVCLERLRKSTKNVWIVGALAQNRTWAFSKYKSETLTLGSNIQIPCLKYSFPQTLITGTWYLSFIPHMVSRISMPLFFRKFILVPKRFYGHISTQAFIQSIYEYSNGMGAEHYKENYILPVVMY